MILLNIEDDNEIALSKDIIVSCFGKIIRISLFNTFEKENLWFWLNRFCPGVEMSTSADFDYEIVCILNSYHRYEIFSEECLKLFSSWDYDYTPFLAKLVTQVFQKLLNADGFYIISASCIITHGQAVLFVGDFWQGKTSAALNTCKRWDEIELISDNYVIVKNRTVLAGTKYISLREENEFRYRHLIKGSVYKTVNSRKFFRHESGKKNGDIVAFVTPHINSGDNNFHIISREESLWYLFQKFSRIINGEAILFNGNSPPPNFDNKKLSTQRLIDLRNISDIRLHFASSNIDNISDYVIGLLKT